LNQISDTELQAIVKNVVSRTMGSPETENTKIPCTGSGKKAIAIGSDHGGFDMKEALKNDLTAAGHEIIDCGTFSKEACDYPDFALAVAQQVSDGLVCRGIVIDGAGIGSCMVANKVPGVRAALCYDYSSAVNSREHNNANVLTLGAGLIGINLAKQIVQVWLATDFGGGRHAKRVDKINLVENQYLKRR